MQRNAGIEKSVMNIVAHQRTTKFAIEQKRSNKGETKKGGINSAQMGSRGPKPTRGNEDQKILHWGSCRAIAE